MTTKKETKSIQLYGDPRSSEILAIIFDTEGNFHYAEALPKHSIELVEVVNASAVEFGESINKEIRVIWFNSALGSEEGTLPQSFSHIRKNIIATGVEGQENIFLCTLATYNFRLAAIAMLETQAMLKLEVQKEFGKSYNLISVKAIQVAMTSYISGLRSGAPSDDSFMFCCKAGVTQYHKSCPDGIGGDASMRKMMGGQTDDTNDTIKMLEALLSKTRPN